MHTRDRVRFANGSFGSKLSMKLRASLLLAVLAYAAPATAGDDEAADSQNVKSSGAIATTQAYVEQYYPLWFTHHQSRLIPNNQLVGPDRISAIYHAVVAINDDTLYASTAVNFSSGPVILSVPETAGCYSVLVLDAYGNVLETGVPSQPPGTTFPARVYGLVPQNYDGPLPSGVIPVPLPYDLQFLIFRADKYTPDNVNQVRQAEEFRRGLKLQPLSDYLTDPSGGAARILPEIGSAIPFRTISDALIRLDPVRFLEELQVAVHSGIAPPLTADEQELSDAFDAVFGTGGSSLTPQTRIAVRIGAQAAHEAILDNYLSSRGPNNWIHFTNMGKWGDAVLDRASITAFIQYGNDISAAAYYHAFRDQTGQPLVGTTRGGYVLTFPPGGQPDAERFWSLTAYTPNAIELIPNLAHKYVVARYTPGLYTNPDGSVSIYVSQVKPEGVPEANWLPVSRRPFNLMLRVYGVIPGSSVADDTYVVPPVVKRLAH